MFNLQDALKLFLLLREAIPETIDENELAMVYSRKILENVQKISPRIFYEVLNMGQPMTVQEFADKSPDEVFSLFMEILADNRILSLKDFFEGVLDA